MEKAIKLLDLEMANFCSSREAGAGSCYGQLNPGYLMPYKNARQ